MTARGATVRARRPASARTRWAGELGPGSLPPAGLVQKMDIIEVISDSFYVERCNLGNTLLWIGTSQFVFINIILKYRLSVSIILFVSFNLPLSRYHDLWKTSSTPVAR